VTRPLFALELVDPAETRDHRSSLFAPAARASFVSHVTLSLLPHRDNPTCRQHSQRSLDTSRPSSTTSSPPTLAIAVRQFHSFF
jgi:hypothetical protein